MPAWINRCPVPRGGPEHKRILDWECTDLEAEKGCRACGGELKGERHWATLKWAAANWYCSRECAAAVEDAARKAEEKS